MLTQVPTTSQTFSTTTATLIQWGTIIAANTLGSIGLTYSASGHPTGSFTNTTTFTLVIEVQYNLIWNSSVAGATYISVNGSNYGLTQFSSYVFTNSATFLLAPNQHFSVYSQNSSTGVTLQTSSTIVITSLSVGPQGPTGVTGNTGTVGPTGGQGLQGLSGVTLPMPNNMILGIVGNVPADFTINQYTNQTVITRTTNNVNTSYTNHWYSPNPISLANSNATTGNAQPQANFIIAGSITPTTSAPYQQWMVGLHYQTTWNPTAGIWFGIGITYLNDQYHIGIYDADAGGNPYLQTTIISPSTAGTSASYYLYFTPTYFQFWYNNQLIYTNSAPIYRQSGHNPPYQFYVSGGLADNYSGTLYGTGSQMTVSAGFSNQYPIYASPNTSHDLTVTATSITKQQNDTTINYVGTYATFPYVYLTCTVNLTNTYSQFIGLSSTGITGNAYGFQYYTDGNLYVSVAGAQTFSLGTPTFPVALGIELSSGTILFYYNNLIVYSIIPTAGTYQGVFQVAAINDLISNIAFGYFRGATIGQLWASWNDAAISSGDWYNSAGTLITNFSTGGTFFFDTLVRNQNVKSNFVLTAPTQITQYHVPVPGIYIIQWTIDSLSTWNGIKAFISVNDGSGSDLDNFTCLAVQQTSGQDLICLSATLKLLTTDYFSLGVLWGGGGGTSVALGNYSSVTVSYVG